MLTMSTNRLGQTIGRHIERALLEARSEIRLDNVLTAQARRRIDNSGDSMGRYPKLKPIGERGRDPEAKPLWDTGRHIRDRLFGAMARSSRGVVAYLRGPLLAVFHHHGFKTKGPNFIPLNRKAARTHRKGADPQTEGLVPGKDYIMAWRGVRVPARPIYRLAPEDRDEIRDAIVSAIRDEFA